MKKEKSFFGLKNSTVPNSVSQINITDSGVGEGSFYAKGVRLKFLFLLVALFFWVVPFVSGQGSEVITTKTPPLLSFPVDGYGVRLYEGYHKDAGTTRIYYPPYIGFSSTSTNVWDQVVTNEEKIVTVRIPFQVSDEAYETYIVERTQNDPKFKTKFPAGNTLFSAGSSRNLIFEPIPFDDAKILVVSDDVNRPGTLASIDVIKSGGRISDDNWKLRLEFPSPDDYDFFVKGLDNGNVRFDVTLIVQKVQVQNASIYSSSINRITSSLRSVLSEDSASKGAYLSQETWNMLKNSIKLQFSTDIKTDMGQFVLENSLDQLAEEMLKLCFKHTVKTYNWKDLPDSSLVVVPGTTTATRNNEEGSEEHLTTVGSTRFHTSTRSKGGGASVGFGPFSLGASTQVTTTDGSSQTTERRDGEGKGWLNDTNVLTDGYAKFKLYHITANQMDLSHDITIFKNISLTTCTKESYLELPSFDKRHSMESMRKWCVAQTKNDEQKRAVLRADISSELEKLNKEKDEINGYVRLIGRTLGGIDPNDSSYDTLKRAAINFVNDPLFRDLSRLTKVDCSAPTGENVMTQWMNWVNMQLDIPKDVTVYENEKSLSKLGNKLEDLKKINAILKNLEPRLRSLVGEL